MPVAQAEIVALEKKTGARFELKSAENGRYHLLWIPIGEYQVTVTKAGFAQRQEKIVVSDRVTLDLLLLIADDPNPTSAAESSDPESSIGNNAAKDVTAGPVVVAAMFQATPGKPAQNVARSHRLKAEASIRSRLEVWDWFPASANNTYVYLGTVGKLDLTLETGKSHFQGQVEVPLLLNLPSSSIAPDPQGSLGLGATYFAANNKEKNVAAAFINALYWESSFSGRFRIRVGRFDFLDGLEYAAPNATLAAVKRTRVAERLISTNPWTHGARSFDGLQGDLQLGSYHVTALAAVPREGMFQASGWKSMETPFEYVSISSVKEGNGTSWDSRLFAAHYDDLRGLVPTDSRPLESRRGSPKDVSITTAGAHRLTSIKNHFGEFDVLLWGAVQFGRWSNLRQRAFAYAIEGGWQPKYFPKVKPWVRTGWDQTSGDSNPNDGVHGTFVPFLLGPRPFARVPFFTQMNLSDLFAEVVLRPTKTVQLRSDVHRLWLTDGSDLWYQGAGAYQSTTFGFAGRPSGGGRDLGTLYDVSVELTPTSKTSVGFYVGAVSGGAVVQTSYPAGQNMRFGYIEITRKF